MAFALGIDAPPGKMTESGLIVYDDRGRQIMSSFYSKFPIALPEFGEAPMVRLTPDGRKLVVEEYNWIQDNGINKGHWLRHKTGRLAIYEAGSGMLLRVAELDLSHEPQEGRMRIEGFSEDSHTLYYSSWDHLFILDLESGELRSKVELHKFDIVGIIEGPSSH